jgi:RNA 2',3'-cyclic 3'-phosphodiesterase
MIRAFIALPLPENVKEELLRVSSTLRKTMDARWVRLEAMHLTMKFLGDIDEENIEGMSKKLDELSELYQPFSMSLCGLGAFPSPKRARVVWAGVDADVSRLRNLAASIDDMSSDYGIAKEGRPFTAHVTLARLREPSMINLDVRIEKITFIIDTMHFYKSDLTPQGARYTLLHSSPFTGKPGG